MAATTKKPWRNFRRKVADESDSEDNKNEQQDDDMEIEEERSVAEVIEKPIKKKKKKKDKKESSKLLSFEDDHDVDDGDVFKIKKSSQSKRLAKQLKKERMKEKEENSKVKEENPNANDLPMKKSEEETDEKIRKLREEFMTLNGDDAAALDVDSEEEDKGTLHKLLGKGEIPDANMIHNIRKKRQQARDMGDFVPLDNAAKPENATSRLIREDDNDKSEDEDVRMDFTVNVEALERQRIKDQFLAAEHGSDEESDQEREWEAQQIKKGVTVGQPVDTKAEDQEESNDDAGQSNGYIYQSTTTATTFQPFTAMSKTNNLADINMDVIKKRLKERLDSMEEVGRRHTQERENLINDIEDADQSTVTCEGSVDALERRYRFFQEMRGYVRDLVECLNEKVG